MCNLKSVFTVRVDVWDRSRGILTTYQVSVQQRLNTHKINTTISVSYTHLTLPTIYSV